MKEPPVTLGGAETQKKERGRTMTTPANELPPILTVPEAAAFLRIGRTAAYEAVRLGLIPSVRLGRLVRIPRDALLAWLAADGEVKQDGARR